MKAEGLEDLKAMKFSGQFSDQEIDAYKSDTSTDMVNVGGFSPDEVKGYWGDVEPDTTAMKSVVNDNLAKAKAENQGTDGKKPKEATDFLEAVESGWQSTGIGMLARGGLPEIVPPEHMDTAMRIGNMAGSLYGDVIPMTLGGLIGGIAGTPEAPGVGTAAGIGAGSFALPEALRKVMVDHYEKGDIKSASDFAERLVSTTWETLKQGALGAVTFGAGKYVGGKVAKGAVQTLAQGATELAAMTGLSSAMQGHLPEPQDFLANGALLLGVHGITRGAEALGRKFVASGEMPIDVANTAQTDVILKQELASNPRPEMGPTEVLKAGTPEVNGVQDPTEVQVEVPKGTVTKSEYVPSNPDIPRTDAEKKVLSIIGEQQESPSDAKMSVGDRMYTDFVNDLHPLKLAVDDLTDGQGTSPERNPEIIAQVARGWSRKALAFIKYGHFDFNTGEKIDGSEGLVQILNDVPGKDKDGLLAYMIAARSIEKGFQGINTGVDVEAAKEVMNTNSQFKPIADRMVKFQNGMLDYAVKSQILTPKAAEVFKTNNAFYIPFDRIFAVDPLTGKPSKAGSLFKKMTGSDAKIVDPIQSMYKNTMAIVKAAEMNRVRLSLLDLQESSVNGVKLFEKVKGIVKPIDLLPKEVGKILDDHGVDPDTAAGAATIFRAENQILKDNEFTVRRDGKMETWRTTPDIAEAIKAFDGNKGAINLFVHLTSNVAKAFRFSTTGTAEFVVNNMIRDQATTSIQSKYGQIPFVEIAQSLGSIFGESKKWQEFLASGASEASLAAIDGYLKNDIWALNKKTGFLNASWNMIKSPLHAIQVASELIEALPRYTEFRKSPGGIEGAHAAREVSVDFSKKGRVMGDYQGMTAFMGPGIQGIDKLVQTFREDPFGATKKALMYVTIPTIINWWRNKDDSRYQNAPGWERDTDHIITTDKWEPAYSLNDAMLRQPDQRRLVDGKWEVNNGNVYRMPKGYEYGMIFGSGVERLLNAFYKGTGKDEFKNFGESMQSVFVPNLLPTFASGPAEQWANKSFFLNRPIVPQWAQEKLPADQYNDYTSETAKAIGKIIGWCPVLRDFGPDHVKLESPMVVDNYIKTMGGTMGQYAVSLIDAGLTATGLAETKAELPMKKLMENPFLRSFNVRYPTYQAENIQNFQDNFDEIRTIKGSIKSAQERGDFQRAVKLQQDYPESVLSLESERKAMTEYNKAIQKVTIDPKMNKDEKRQLIDTFYYQMYNIADRANEQVKKIKDNAANNMNRLN